MEQQPKVVREEINEESKKEVVEVEKMDPSPMLDPKPSEGNDGKDKCEDNNDQKDEKVKDLIITETGSHANNVEVNGDGIESNNSATPPSRSKKSVRWSRELVVESEIPVYSEDHGSNQYDNYSSTRSIEPSSSFNMKDKMDSVKDLLGRWRRNVGEVTRKAEDFAGNTWQHLKTSPSFADAALGRLAQGTKVLAEGGYEKIFCQTFETVPEEQLQNSYACYLSTSAGPVMGVLYVSTAKLAFCSDNPLSYKVDDNTEWSFYKVVIPLHQLKAVNPSTSRTNSAEKYIQVISVDNHEFWYMGFLNYESAVKCLQEVLEARYTQAV